MGFNKAALLILFANGTCNSLAGDPSFEEMRSSFQHMLFFSMYLLVLDPTSPETKNPAAVGMVNC